MNKDIAIITEGEFDAKVLQRLLKDKNFAINYEILPADGYSSALSKAKSLLSVTNKQIVLLLDTNSIEENQIREKKDFINFYVNTGVNKDNFKAFWAIPEFEIIFLENKKFLKALFSIELTEDLLEVAKSAPRRTLEFISKKKREQFIDLLEEREIRDEFLKAGLIKDICDYIEFGDSGTGNKMAFDPLEEIEELENKNDF